MFTDIIQIWLKCEYHINLQCQLMSCTDIKVLIYNLYIAFLSLMWWCPCNHVYPPTKVKVSGDLAKPIVSPNHSFAIRTCMVDIFQSVNAEGNEAATKPASGKKKNIYPWISQVVLMANLIKAPSNLVGLSLNIHRQSLRTISKIIPKYAATSTTGYLCQRLEYAAKVNWLHTVILENPLIRFHLFWKESFYKRSKKLT